MTEKEAQMIWFVDMLWGLAEDALPERDFRLVAFKKFLDGFDWYSKESVAEAMKVLKKKQKGVCDPPYTPGTRYGLMQRSSLSWLEEGDDD